MRGDVAARIAAEERARVAEERAATLSAEVVSLRAAASRSEMLAAQSRDPKGGRDAETAARAPPDAGVSYSAQVAAAATAAASVTLEARVSEATAAARSATDEAEATKVEIEVLRNLIDEGFLPGGAGGKCWAEVADARAKAQITAASVASAEAKRNAEAMLSEKLTLYADARRDAERKSDAYRVELEALRAAAPELRLVADDADARADGRTDADVRTDATDREHSRVVARTRKTVVGASRLVAAAKVASERVRDAATALRDAESRAEVRRVELETLRHLVAGNGTAGVIDRAERVVSELPGAAARAAEAADRRVAARLRAEEEARAQAETKAEVYRVELASLRAIEAERAEAEAEAEARGDETGRGFGHDRGRGSAKALAAEVRRLEKALAEASASASVAAATPEAASAAATAAATAAADAAAEADAARERTLDRAPLVRRVAARIVAWTLGESHETRDALRRRVVSLERRLVAMTRATAVGPGPACAAALTEALDATRRAGRTRSLCPWNSTPRVASPPRCATGTTTPPPTRSSSPRINTGDCSRPNETPIERRWRAVAGTRRRRRSARLSRRKPPRTRRISSRDTNCDWRRNLSRRDAQTPCDAPSEPSKPARTRTGQNLGQNPGPNRAWSLRPRPRSTRSTPPSPPSPRRTLAPSRSRPNFATPSGDGDSRRELSTRTFRGNTPKRTRGYCARRRARWPWR